MLLGVSRKGDSCSASQTFSPLYGTKVSLQLATCTA